MIELGCIADDLTGATDLGINLSSEGMHVLQLIGVPGEDPDPGLIEKADAVIVALKSRNCDPQAAVSASRASANWLRKASAHRIYFKYCSTFDSTPAGNIGPVTVALMEDTGSELAVVCPASPENGRTVRNGELLVNGVPLAETHMRHHPSTPMTESSLLTLMDAQSEPDQTGVVTLETVRSGAEAVIRAFDNLHRSACSFAVCDAETEEDLQTIAEASGPRVLLTGAAGLGRGFARNLRQRATAGKDDKTIALPRLPGHVVILSGSCSARSVEQVDHAGGHIPAMRIDVMRISEPDYIESFIKETVARAIQDNLLIYSTAAENKRPLTSNTGLGEQIESFHARLARALRRAGVRKFIIAGGETAGSVVRALGVTGMMVGDVIDPGVPWTVTTTEPALLLACKSGNFGAVDFFTRAVEMVT